MPPIAENNRRSESALRLGKSRASKSEDCPVVLVSGFLGPSNDHWCEKYWGEAVALGTLTSPVIVAPVSCVGSCFDRACELYAQLRGLRVDYGKEHAEKHGHDQFGKDFTGKAKYAQWSEQDPIHLVGHSFGGNTVRVFRYLIATDFFQHGTNSAWIRSVTTLSSPLKGSLITYALGATQDHSPEKPVHMFSPGYMLGVGVHFYELFCHKVGMSKWLDLGMDHWGLERGGVSLWLKSFLGGTNGGGTPAVCSMDNAAHDMTFKHAEQWNEKVQSVLENDPLAFEFNFVAKKADVMSYSLNKARERFFETHPVHLTDDSSESQHVEPRFERRSFLHSACLAVKDFWVYVGARMLHKDDFNITMDDREKSYPIKDHCVGEADGLCSGVSQHFKQGLVTEEELFKIDSVLPPGQYSVLLDPCHDHFSIVPFPDHASIQRAFFQRLFHTLRTLTLPPMAVACPTTTVASSSEQQQQVSTAA